ncbi:hypothetical protein O6H91_07G038200 [Diphasiastrum complanatum]|nr:hypothetical protein O6H91_07G038200 [Diphasiastrum complanatum]
MKANTQPKSPQHFHFPSNSSNDSRKAGSGQKKGYHQPSFVCDCFQCYMFHWSRWDASPNQALIHKAILLNESIGPSRSEPDLLKVEVTPDDKTLSFVECYEEKARSGSPFGSKKAEEKAFRLEEPLVLNPDEVVALDSAQEVVDENLLKFRNYEASSEKTPAMEAVVTERSTHRQGSLEMSPGRYLFKEENKAQKKKSAKKVKPAAKGNSGKQQEMNLHASPGKKKKAELPTKYRTKQVAPIMDFKDECAAETSTPEPEADKLQNRTADTKREETGKLQPSYSHVFSETLSFVADRLFSLWYPRRPRGISVL